VYRKTAVEKNGRIRGGLKMNIGSNVNSMEKHQVGKLSADLQKNNNRGPRMTENMRAKSSPSNSTSAQRMMLLINIHCYVDDDQLHQEVSAEFRDDQSRHSTNFPIISPITRTATRYAAIGMT